MNPSRHFIALAICTPFLLACSDQATNADAPAADVPAGAAGAGAAPDLANIPAGTVAVAVNAASADEALPLSREPDVIYVPTPQPVVDAMLNLAQVKAGDVLYDLGSGDGRIPITAAGRFGVRAVGYDINPVRIREANANAEAAGVTDLVTFKQADLFEEDISEASVVMLYLLQSLNVQLRPKLLAELEPGTRIVSHAFDMADQWEPEVTQTIGSSTIYLWTVPER